MSGTQISAAPHATTPINPASRVPIADPLQSGVKISAAASDIARAASQVIVTMSELGITSDATNGIDYTSTAPSGSSGQEATINTAFATIAAAAGQNGVFVIWDVAVALGGPIYLYSNMTIYAPDYACGSIGRVGNNTPIFRLKGMDADQTIAANSQKSFGQYDPAHSGDTRYRVYNPAYVNANNVAVIGGTWNANSAQRTSDVHWNGLYGFVSSFQFWGCNKLTLRDCRIFDSYAMPVHTCNCANVSVTGLDVDLKQWLTGDTQLNGCFQIDGPQQRLFYDNNKSHTFDDHYGINADDESSSNYLAGVSWGCAGTISNVEIRNHTIWNGRENTASRGCIRFLSTASLIDQVHVKGIRGQTSLWAVLMQVDASALISGPGNVGRIVIEDFEVDLTSSAQPGVFALNFVADVIEIRNRLRYEAQAVPDFAITNGGVNQLIITGDYYNPDSSGANEPVLAISAGGVDCLTMNVKTSRYSTLSTGAAPVLAVSGSGLVNCADLTVNANRITNVVTYAAGTFGTLILRGSHRNASGGSPLSISSGATLTNYWYKDLAFTGTSKSGSGTVTNDNSYGGP